MSKQASDARGSYDAPRASELRRFSVLVSRREALGAPRVADPAAAAGSVAAVEAAGPAVRHLAALSGLLPVRSRWAARSVGGLERAALFLR